MREKMTIMTAPASHPNWAMAHANDSTPDPITAVIMWALAVIHVPSKPCNQKVKSLNRLKLEGIQST